MSLLQGIVLLLIVTQSLSTIGNAGFEGRDNSTSLPKSPSKQMMEISARVNESPLPPVPDAMNRLKKELSLWGAAVLKKNSEFEKVTGYDKDSYMELHNGTDGIFGPMPKEWSRLKGQIENFEQKMKKEIRKAVHEFVSDPPGAKGVSDDDTTESILSIVNIIGTLPPEWSELTKEIGKVQSSTRAKDLKKQAEEGLSSRSLNTDRSGLKARDSSLSERTADIKVTGPGADALHLMQDFKKSTDRWTKEIKQKFKSITKTLDSIRDVNVTAKDNETDITDSIINDIVDWSNRIASKLGELRNEYASIVVTEPKNITNITARAYRPEDWTEMKNEFMQFGKEMAKLKSEMEQYETVTEEPGPGNNITARAYRPEDWTEIKNEFMTFGKEMEELKTELEQLVTDLSFGSERKMESGMKQGNFNGENVNAGGKEDNRINESENNKNRNKSRISTPNSEIVNQQLQTRKIPFEKTALWILRKTWEMLKNIADFFNFKRRKLFKD